MVLHTIFQQDAVLPVSTYTLLVIITYRPLETSRLLSPKILSTRQVLGE